MNTDTEIRTIGLEALLAKLGEVNTERFISLIIREPFDYTKWQKNLLASKTIEQISNLAMEKRRPK